MAVGVFGQSDAKKGTLSEESVPKGFLKGRKLKLETCTKLHLEYRAAWTRVKIDLPKGRAGGGLLTDLEEIDVGHAARSAKLRTG